MKSIDIQIIEEKDGTFYTEVKVSPLHYEVKRPTADQCQQAVKVFLEKRGYKLGDVSHCIIYRPKELSIEEILVKLIDHLIVEKEINEVVELKNKLVRVQQFQLASDAKDKETELYKKLLTLEELKGLREQLI